jgi:hypothetical protein
MGVEVGPCVIERAKARSLGGHGGQRVQKIAGRAGQPVKARDGEHVALGELVESAAQLFDWLYVTAFASPAKSDLLVSV